MPFDMGCRVCTHGCRSAWLCLLRHGISSGSYTACVAEAVADELRAEARLLATKAKATLKIKTPYIAKHKAAVYIYEAKRQAAVEEAMWRHEQMVAKVRQEDDREAKRKAAMEEELWRHEQMVAKVREEDLKQEQTSFARTLTSEQVHMPGDALAALPESPGGASATARLASVLSPSA